METNTSVRFLIQSNPGGEIHFEAAGDIVDQMQAIVSVMQASPHARQLILSCASYWKENPSRGTMEAMIKKFTPKS